VLDCEADFDSYISIRFDVDLFGTGGAREVEAKGSVGEEEEVEGKRSRASLIGLERLRGSGGRFCGVLAVGDCLNEPRKRVRKVPDPDEVLEAVSAASSRTERLPHLQQPQAVAI